MKTMTFGIPVFLACTAILAAPAGPSMESAPPVVVNSIPIAGSADIDPNLTEIRATFSKPMQDLSWSWATWSKESFPEMTGKPKYLPDQRTCVLPVKLEPGKFYAVWVNSERHRNFKDSHGIPALPYLITFQTAFPKDGLDKDSVSTSTVPDPFLERLNPDQRMVLEWTDGQFRGFFDRRSFSGWSTEDRAELETRLIDALRGPISREYYQAINSLAALRSTRAIPNLREIAFDRRDKNNRDRWMSIRALGLIGDTSSIPEFIHLLYHGNVNTRWWAQLSLVRLSDQNLGNDWRAWSKWWNDSGGQPPCSPEIIRWWSGQARSGETRRITQRKRSHLPRQAPHGKLKGPVHGESRPPKIGRALGP
jgi:RNA polymerase sigma-70 factor (ECF subfamily)